MLSMPGCVYMLYLEFSWPSFLCGQTSERSSAQIGTNGNPEKKNNGCPPRQRSGQSCKYQSLKLSLHAWLLGNLAGYMKSAMECINRNRSLDNNRAYDAKTVNIILLLICISKECMWAYHVNHKAVYMYSRYLYCRLRTVLQHNSLLLPKSHLNLHWSTKSNCKQIRLAEKLTQKHFNLTPHDSWGSWCLTFNIWWPQIFNMSRHHIQGSY